MSENETYTLTVNGSKREVTDSWIGESLLYVLRERLGLPGAKGACEQGECGSCTVMMDGAAVPGASHRATFLASLYGEGDVLQGRPNLLSWFNSLRET